LVKTPEELAGVDAIVLPGGESTTVDKLLDSSGLRTPLRDALRDGMPALAVCAGLIVLAREVVDGRADQQPLGAIDVTVRRNGYGRQRESFETPLGVVALPGGPFPGVFIRAPVVERVGAGVEILAEHDGHAVLGRDGNVLFATFHPELAGDLRVHQLFLDA
jgi:pyridoxal 5'-phosphate synthase pdxT subunit